MIPNVLAERYASPALQAIWSAEGRIVLEREFWIAVMKAQTAHKAIKEHAVGTVNDLRTGKTTVNDLVDRLANDGRIPLDRAQIAAIVAAGESNAGTAFAQVAAFAKAVGEIEAAHPEAAAYSPGSIL